MNKNLLIKKDLVVGAMLLSIGIAVTLVFVMPVSAIIPQIPHVTKKSLDTKTFFISEEWIEQATAFPDRNRGINYISCVNESVVWATAINGDGWIYACQDYTRTVNGGATWVANTIPDVDNLYFSMIFALDANTAWAPMNAFQNGVMGLFYTSDGGNTWIKQESANFNLVGSFPNCVHFWDANIGWCITNDAGTTWVRVPQENIPIPLLGEYGFIGSYCVIGDTIWFGTNMGRVYKSIDKGLHWTVAQTTLRSYTKPTFKDENHGLVFDINPAGSGALSETSDGGLTWQNVDFVGPCYNYDIRYIPGTVNMYISVGAASGASGASYSRDGGHTWTDYADMVGIPLLSLGFTTGKIGWAGSFNTDETTGGIFKHIPTGNPQPAFSMDIIGGKGFIIIIQNVGEVNATDFTCEITIDDGLFIKPKIFSGSQANLGIGKNFTVLGAPKGIGLGILTPIPKITINVNCTEGISTTKMVQAKIFFSKVTIQ